MSEKIPSWPSCMDPEALARIEAALREHVNDPIVYSTGPPDGCPDYDPHEPDGDDWPPEAADDGEPAPQPEGVDLAALVVLINNEHEAGEAAHRESMEHFRACGVAISKAKAECERQKIPWVRWLEENCPALGRVRAWRYWRLAKDAVTLRNDPEALRERWRQICGNAPAPVAEEEDEDGAANDAEAAKNSGATATKAPAAENSGAPDGKSDKAKTPADVPKPLSLWLTPAERALFLEQVWYLMRVGEIDNETDAVREAVRLWYERGRPEVPERRAGRRVEVVPLPEKDVADLEHQPLDATHYDEVLGGEGGVDLDVFAADADADDMPLVVYRPRVLDVGGLDLPRLLPALRRCAKESETRGPATGHVPGARHGAFGYFEPDYRNRKPHAHPAPWTDDDPEGWAALQPLLRQLARIYQEALPEVFADQQRYADTMGQGWRIPETPFTTGTVNYSAPGHPLPFRAHRDDGNLHHGYSVMAVLGDGWRGCLFVLPRYRKAFDLRPGDVILFESAALHGNTAFGPGTGPGGAYERFSVVCYYRSRLILSGTPAEELERAKRRSTR
jgi:hypothetical protein